MPPEAKALPFLLTAYEEDDLAFVVVPALARIKKPTKEELDAITKLITDPKLAITLFALGLLLDMGPMAPVEPLYRAVRDVEPTVKKLGPAQPLPSTTTSRMPVRRLCWR